MVDYLSNYATIYIEGNRFKTKKQVQFIISKHKILLDVESSLTS